MIKICCRECKKWFKFEGEPDGTLFWVSNPSGKPLPYKPIFYCSPCLAKIRKEFDVADRKAG